MHAQKDANELIKTSRPVLEVLSEAVVVLD